MGLHIGYKCKCQQNLGNYAIRTWLSGVVSGLRDSDPPAPRIGIVFVRRGKGWVKWLGGALLCWSFCWSG